VTQQVNQLIDEGVSAGDIRDDVGTDLRNLIRNVTASQSPAERTARVAEARRKLVDRQREGSITTAYVRQIDSAIVVLGSAD
jgi:serine/threonine-protein kinase